VPERPFAVTPLQPSDAHHSVCPICGALVDKLDLEEVLRHLEPDHLPPKH